MNRFLKTSLISTLALASIGGTGYAAGSSGAAPSFNNHDEALPPAIAKSPARTGGSGGVMRFDLSASRDADRAIRHWRGRAFDVEQVSGINDDLQREMLRDRKTAEPRQVAALHSAIEHNHRLLSRLNAENVEIGNIVAADAAMNGSLTFYVE